MARQRRSNGQGTLFKRTEGGPWLASWYDHTGKRKERSTRTTDRRAAERILAKHVADTALRREGVIDDRLDRFSVENRKPLVEHVKGYLDHCRHAGHAAKHIVEKVRHLDRILFGTGATRLSELTADAMERHLRGMMGSGLSARTANFARQIAVAFMNWCVKTGRAESNPLTVVAKQDEQRDRRRVRRALSDDELARLLDVAEARGRRAWYMAAAFAGLRKGDLQRLTWGDVDFEAGTITISEGKAKRTDVIPLHAQLADELKRRLEENPALPGARVFPETVTDLTRKKDFLRAGLARREVVTDAEGQPVMIGKGKHRRAKTCIVTKDAEGRVVDLHAMRATLATRLCRVGVKPQYLQRIMRHADYRTTLKHYTCLEIADTTNAMAQLPSIDLTPQREAATGTMDATPRKDPQLYPQQLTHETARDSAKGRNGQSGASPEQIDVPALSQGAQPVSDAGHDDTARDDAAKSDDPAEGSRESGRSDSNRRRSAWEADILPLNYARDAWAMDQQAHTLGQRIAG